MKKKQEIQAEPAHKGDYGVTELVKDEDRHYTFFDMFTTWAGANCQPNTWRIGGCIAAGGLMCAIKINLITVPIMFIIVGLIGYIGFKCPTTSMGFCRTIFGISSSRFLSALHAITQMGWAGVGCYLGACSLSYLFNSLWGWPCAGMDGSLPVLALGTFIVAGLTCLLVLADGSKTIKIFSKVATVGIIVMSIWIAVAVFKTYSMKEIMNWRAPAEYALSFGVGTDKITAYAFGWVICTIEFTRYTKTKAAASAAPMLGSWIGLSLFALIGTVGVIASALTTGVFNEYSGDPSSIAASLGLGIPAFLVVLLSVVTTTVVSFFSGGNSALNMVDDKIPQKKMMRIYSAICFVVAFLPLAFGSFMDFFYAFMDVLGLLWPGIGAIMIADFYIVRRQKYQLDRLSDRSGPYMYTHGINLYAWVPYLLGVASYLIFKNIPAFYNVFGALYPSVVIAFVSYLISAGIAKKRGAYRDLVSA